MNFLLQVVYNDFLPSCYIRYSQVFSLFIYLFVELKYKKCCNLLSHNYFLFTFDKKCLKVIAFSKQDGLKMNGMVQSWDQEKNGTVAIVNYCSKDVSVANMEKATLTSHVKDKKHVERSPSDQCIKSLMPPTVVPPLIILKITLSGVRSVQQ